MPGSDELEIEGLSLLSPSSGAKDPAFQTKREYWHDECRSFLALGRALHNPTE